MFQSFSPKRAAERRVRQTHDRPSRRRLAARPHGPMRLGGKAARKRPFYAMTPYITMLRTRESAKANTTGTLLLFTRSMVL